MGFCMAPQKYIPFPEKMLKKNLNLQFLRKMGCNGPSTAPLEESEEFFVFLFMILVCKAAVVN